MKLGNLVTFTDHYIKSGEGFFPHEHSTDEEKENGVTVRRWKKESGSKQREGIVVGKRRYASGYEFHYVECYPHEKDDWKWISQPLEKESFYLVATNLNSMFKVKPEDLELKFHEDAIEGLIDE